MTIVSDNRIRDGRELKCPHCGQWHLIEKAVGDGGGTAYADSMRYFTCDSKRYFAGTVGATGQYPTRPRPS